MVQVLPSDNRSAPCNGHHLIKPYPEVGAGTSNKETGNTSAEMLSSNLNMNHSDFSI